MTKSLYLIQKQIFSTILIEIQRDFYFEKKNTILMLLLTDIREIKLMYMQRK